MRTQSKKEVPPVLSSEEREQIQLCYRFWMVENDFYQSFADAHHLTLSQLKTLLSLWEAQTPCTAQLICEHTHLPKQTVANLVKSFVEKELINLAPNPDDRRSKLITLTEKGRDICRPIFEQLHEAEAQILRLMTPRERTLLKEIISKELVLTEHVIAQMNPSPSEP